MRLRYADGANINEQTIVDLTDATVARGLRAAGYRYIWLDAGWWYGQRDVNGRIVVDPALWPHGMTWMVNYIHSHGFLAGIYTDLASKPQAANWFTSCCRIARANVRCV